MTFKEIIRTALKETNTTQQRLADAMGYRHGQANVAKVLSRNDIYISTLIKMLDRLGYEIVVQPRTRGRRPDGTYVITGQEAVTEQDE